MRYNKLASKINGRFHRVLVLAFLLFSNSLAYPQQDSSGLKVHLNLTEELKEFDNQGQPLIPTLLRIAAAYHLPMGIERVVKEALMKSVKVELKRGTIAELLDLCIRQLPGYSWAEREGVIHVYGAKEFQDPSNLFNMVIPSFKVAEVTIGTLDTRLRMTVIQVKMKSSGGIVGSYSPNPELEAKRLSVDIQNASVREILNRLVALHGEAYWISRVPPEALFRLPQAGLWQVLPRSVQNPKNFLEPELN